MRKFLVITIPIVAIALFVFIMLSDKILKKPLTNNDNIPSSIEDVRNEIENENWKDAKTKTDILQKTWDKIVKRVQFSAEKDEINGFYKSISRLQGAIQAMDKANAYMELNEAYEHWENLGK